jgi:hypothetical protein
MGAKGHPPPGLALVWGDGPGPRQAALHCGACPCLDVTAAYGPSGERERFGLQGSPPFSSCSTTKGDPSGLEGRCSTEAGPERIPLHCSEGPVTLWAPGSARHTRAGQRVAGDLLIGASDVQFRSGTGPSTLRFPPMAIDADAVPSQAWTLFQEEKMAGPFTWGVGRPGRILPPFGCGRGAKGGRCRSHVHRLVAGPTRPETGPEGRPLPPAPTLPDR